MSDKSQPMEFLNSVIQGLVVLAYDWQGSGYGTMGSLVGTAIVDKLSLPQAKEGQENKDAAMDQLCALLERELTTRFGVASKIKLSRSENKGLTLEVDNCVLLPIEDYVISKGMRSRRLFCPVVNIILESLYRMGIDSETRSWSIGTRENGRCRHVIGIMDEVAMATEIKSGK